MGRRLEKYLGPPLTRRHNHRFRAGKYTLNDWAFVMACGLLHRVTVAAGSTTKTVRLLQSSVSIAYSELQPKDIPQAMSVLVNLIYTQSPHTYMAVHRRIYG